jgi:hypothetical protein
MITYCLPLPPTVVPIEDQHCRYFGTLEAFNQWLKDNRIVMPELPCKKDD